MRHLTKRSDFLQAARGNRAPGRAFLLQAVPNKTNDIGIGFTVTKKQGNAPQRNRIKRRLREIIRLHAADYFRTGHNYVLIGRATALNTKFDQLIKDLANAAKRVHQ